MPSHCRTCGEMTDEPLKADQSLPRCQGCETKKAQKRLARRLCRICQKSPAESPFASSFAFICEACKASRASAEAKNAKVSAKYRTPASPQHAHPKVRCFVCQAEKSVLYFAGNPDTVPCRRCRPEWEKRAAHYRKANLQRYGLTPEAFTALLAAQGGGCAICKDVPQATHGRKSPFHIDHDHATGEVRGLLCLLCNHAVERLEKVPGWGKLAERYLLEHRIRKDLGKSLGRVKIPEKAAKNADSPMISTT